MKQELGKIKSIEFGFLSSDRGSLMGFTTHLSGAWGDVHHTSTGKIVKDGLSHIAIALADAKKQHISQMANVPVMVTFDEGTGEIVKDWRVLTEVL